MNALGTISREGGHYLIDAAPHVRMVLRRLFIAADKQGGKVIRIPDTLQNSETIHWFLDRYPMLPSPDAQDTIEYLVQRATSSINLRGQCEGVLAGKSEPLRLEMKIPLREYQELGVKLLMAKRRLLVGDDIGLGKTAIALGAFAAGLNPAIIVCQTHLQKQWVSEAMKFLPRCFPHIVKKGTPYRLPTHNLLVIPYSKLSGWRDALSGYRLIVFDEAQEVRREGTGKYVAAKQISAASDCSLGLTATPVYNYGDEIFNVIDVIDDGVLGSRREFLAEWCVPSGTHYKVTDPAALGSYLAQGHHFLRRRRSEVGRELPPVTRVTETVDHDPKRLRIAEARGLQLARAVLGGTFEERGQAARELDMLMRQQTGISKAPFVAAFVMDMVAAGEPVVLCGWHREVYDVWMEIFAKSGVKAVLYTGSESSTQKQAAVDAFVSGEADVFIMSLRSGAGLNRLQERCSVIVKGELDWSPQVHEQNIGRLQRDGQVGNVTVIYLVSEGGSDPLIANVLGLKREQSEGIINPDTADDPVVTQAESSRASLIAKRILTQHGEILPDGTHV